MNNKSKYINLVIKPTNACNMRCSYCYHSEKGYEAHKMSLKTFEKLCSISMPYLETMSIIWHGGEPLLMGIDFYKEANKIIESYQSKYPIKVKQSFQSNGTLLNEEWIDFFKSNNISLGLSFDGLTNEVTRGNTELLLNKFQLLKDLGKRFGIIQVLNSESIKDVILTYEYYKKLSIDVKFNFIFNAEIIKDKEKMLVPAQTYAKHMIEFFDYWIDDENCNISVDPFNEYIALYYNKSNSCRHNSCLMHWLSVDNQGNITPCGRNFPKEYSLGNIVQYADLRDAFSSEGYLKLLDGAVERRKKCMADCDLYDYCKGGCNNDKLLENGITNNGGFSCVVFTELFKHIQNLFQSDVEIKNPKVLKLIRKLNENK